MQARLNNAQRDAQACLPMPEAARIHDLEAGHHVIHNSHLRTPVLASLFCLLHERFTPGCLIWIREHRDGVAQ
jgi:hypothetical protein